MRRASEMLHANCWPWQGGTMALVSGVVVTVLLVATMTTGQAGGLSDWLLPGKGSQPAQAPQSPADAALASVRLRVDGMVCYG
jgi:hypothetical protein